MSHFTTIDVQIKDIEALRAACAELGLELAENAEARGWGGNARHGDFVIRLKGPYDVALNRSAYGTYATEADLWNGHVERELGPNLGRLRQLYAVHKTAIEARRRGLHVRRQGMNDGRIRLTLCRV
ncbi:MAG: hypothetical protein BWZ02_02863 [Lentisphaerae bacterium ADurb.BinA184]|nr:MAG: hypothetical protein BWZ02_02863 [Lentisphaerae bacterium ADurb.BinA184]